MNEVQIIFLGKQRPPSYYEEEIIKYYKIIVDGNYRIGDILVSTTEQQYAFMCPKNLEVYAIHTFIKENNYTLDKDMYSLDDYIEEYCQELIEIY